MLILKKTILINVIAIVLVACGADEPMLSGRSPLVIFAEQEAPLSAGGYQAYCQQAVANAETTLLKLVKHSHLATVHNFLKPLDQLWLKLSNVKNEAALLRDVYPNILIQREANDCERAIANLENQINLSPEIYAGLTRLSSTVRDEATEYYVNDRIAHFQRVGINQSQKARNEIQQLFEEVSVLGSQYNDNIRRAVKSIDVTIEDLQGLPLDTINAYPVNEDGTVTITTDRTDQIPFMRYASSASAREALYRQASSIAYPENIAVLQALLAKRYALARLLGYKNWAEYISSRSMLNSPQQVQALLDDVASITNNKAQQEYDVLLQELQKNEPSLSQVAPWDLSYLRETIKRDRYHVDEKLLRTYFSYHDVKKGIFELSQQLFAIDIEPWNTPVWHEDVEAYKILQNNKIIGYFYLDMHPRNNKYKHNQHLKLRFGVEDKQLPISALVANIPGGKQQAQLLEHTQVRSFLHEFGHLLHHVFAGQQQWFGFSGNTNIPDFVEVPAKMLANWMWSKEVLQSFAKNNKNETIPDDLIKQLQDARYFGDALATTASIYKSALSLQLHNQDPSEFNIAELDKQLQQQYLLISEGNNDFYYRFGHLNAYSAEYYVYLLSQVIANDFFNEFVNGGLLNRETGLRYRSAILAPGGSLPSEQLIYNFLGSNFTLDSTREMFS